MALANDIMAMGRQPANKLGISLFLSGFFAVCYAAGGITFKKKFVFLLVPLF